MDKQYERIDAALKIPIDVLSPATLSADTKTVKINASIVQMNIDVFEPLLSIAAIIVDKIMQIKEGPRKSKSSRASLGEILFV